jgi:hypothetical protein
MLLKRLKIYSWRENNELYIFESFSDLPMKNLPWKEILELQSVEEEKFFCWKK